MLKNQVKTFALRGALGGAIGWLLLVSYIAYKRPFNALALPYAPLIGAIIGTLIGVIIWACFLLAKRNLGIIVRSLIGVGLASVAVLLLILSESRTKSLYQGNRPVENVEISSGYSRGEFMTEMVVIVLLSGALPAAMARPKS
jgi:multisubunit Na+/H+ antiporter MnhC subunit